MHSILAANFLLLDGHTFIADFGDNGQKQANLHVVEAQAVLLTSAECGKWLLNQKQKDLPDDRSFRKERPRQAINEQGPGAARGRNHRKDSGAFAAASRL